MRSVPRQRNISSVQRASRAWSDNGLVRAARRFATSRKLGRPELIIDARRCQALPKELRVGVRKLDPEMRTTKPKQQHLR